MTCKRNVAASNTRISQNIVSGALAYSIFGSFVDKTCAAILYVRIGGEDFVTIATWRHVVKCALARASRISQRLRLLSVPYFLAIVI